MGFGWVKSFFRNGLSFVLCILVLSCGKKSSSVSSVGKLLNDNDLPFTSEEIRILKSGTTVNRSVLLTEEDIRDFRNNDRIFYLSEDEISFFNEKNRYEPMAQASNSVFVCDYEYESFYGGDCKNVGKVYVKECTKVMVKKCLSSNGQKTSRRIFKKIMRSSLNECPTCLGE